MELRITDLPLQPFLDDPVAQAVEHLTFNQGVMGSSPIGITSETSALVSVWLVRASCFGAVVMACRIGYRSGPDFSI